MIDLILFLSLVLGTAYFAFAETGLLSVNPFPLRHQAREGDRAARWILRLTEHREQYLASILIGDNLAKIAAGAVATAWFTRHLGIQWGTLAATVVVTSVVLVFGQILPKAIARERADQAMRLLALPLTITFYILRPLGVLATSSMALVLRGIGGAERVPFLTREELRLLVQESGREGALKGWEKRMLESVFDFARTSAREAMIPLGEAVTIDAEAPVDELKRLVRDRGHTRIPVYRDRADAIVGLANIFDILWDADPKQRVEDYLREMPVVPETKRIDHLLVEMQQGRQTMALVVDEYGSRIGILTVEDIVEEIVGELADEHEAPARHIRDLGDGTWLLDARTRIDELNEALHIALPKERFDTLAGFLLKETGHVPRAGELVRSEEWEFTVLSATPYAIQKVKARRKLEPARPEPRGGE